MWRRAVDRQACCNRRRVACIDVPALPLQWLLRAHRDWEAHPSAVVAEDRPTAPLLFVNEAARRAGVLPGQRYATALALSRDLRAGVVSEAEIAACVDELADRLRRFAPEVEPARSFPGVFWLDAHGLGRLYPQLSSWALSIRDDCAAAGFLAAVVVGFSRFGTYAVARTIREARVFATPREEDAAAHRVLLVRLDVEPKVRDDLLKLGVRTVGDFLKLPALGLLERFGETAFALHRLASGRAWTPLQPKPAGDSFVREEDLGYPDTDAERLLFAAKRLLDPLLLDLARRAQAVAELRVRLKLDDRSTREESLRPAAPTLDATQILNLLRLRFSSLSLSSGVAALRLEAKGEKAAPEQIRLLITRSRRDYGAMARSFARLRAEFGEEAVVRAVLREAHLPRVGFDWERIEALDPEGARPGAAAVRSLVRRIYEKPQPLPPRPRHEPDGWLLRGIEHGRVERFAGPYRVSGGWWHGSGVERDYYFASMSGGDVLWIFYDRRRQRWFLEGRVE